MIIWNSPFWDDNMRLAHRVSMFILVPAIVMTALSGGITGKIGFTLILGSYGLGTLLTIACYVIIPFKLIKRQWIDAFFAWPCVFMINGLYAVVIGGALAILVGTI